MIIEWEDDYEDDGVSVDTDTASREELAAALIKLKAKYDHLHKGWDKAAAELDANGLDFRDTGKRAFLDMVDPDKAFAGFRRMLTEFVEEQIDERRRKKLEELANDERRRKKIEELEDDEA